MHKLSKKISIILATLLASSVLLPLIPAKASTGNILIDTTTEPSHYVKIKLGGSVNLYFGWPFHFSGGQCLLYLSTNGLANLNTTTDIPYGPIFEVGDITNSTIKTSEYPGYSVGNHWINGTIPTSLQVPGGEYWVKAYDGETASVGVTASTITIEATFEVVPASGPGQAAIQLKGYALPPNGFANLSYNAGAGWVPIALLYQADATGKFVYSMLAPDLYEAQPINENAEQFTSITFQMIVNGTGQAAVQDTFDEFKRGLKQVKGKTAKTSASGSLFGNNTDFGLFGVEVEVQGDLIIAGKYFHPGSLNILWDGTLNIGTTTADGEGTFNTTVTIPITSKGTHEVTIDDGKIVFTFKIKVIPTLRLVPDNGPVGTYVTAYGYGFEKSTSIVTYNVTLWWEFTDYCNQELVNLTTVQADSDGRFVTYFYVPPTVGGSRLVNATEDDAATTWATDYFAVTSTLAISPIEFSNDGTIVEVTGTGLDYDLWYDLCLDNKKNFYSGASSYGALLVSYFRPDCTGTFTFEFIATGFSAGNHSVTLYKLAVSSSFPLPKIESYVLFNVLADSIVVNKLDTIIGTLDDLNVLVLGIDGNVATLVTDVGIIKGDIVSIEGDIATIKTDIGTIKVDVSTAASSASAASASASTAATAASGAQTAAEAAQSTASGISTAVYGAVVLSLIAALASIFAVITLQRKVA